MDELTKYANNIIENPLEYLNTYQSRVAFAKDYLRLQKRVEELEKLSNAHKKLACLVDQQQLDLRASISKAVEEINKEWVDGVADGETYNYDDVYQSGIADALDILRKHGLDGGGE